MLKLLLASASAVGVSAFGAQYLYFSCDGEFHIMPGSPLQMSMDFQRPFTAFVQSWPEALTAELKAECPTLTTDEINQYFNFLNVESYLKMMSPNNADFIAGLKAAQLKCPKARMTVLQLPEFTNMPSSFTYDKYMAGSPVSIKWPIEDLNMDLDIQIQKCSGSFLPSFLLGCGGAGCTGLMKPCVKDSECEAPFVCNLLDLPADPWTDMDKALEQVGLYNPTKDDAKCYVGKTAADEKMRFSERFVTQLIDKMLPIMGFGATPIGMTSLTKLGMCAPKTVLDTITGIGGDILGPGTSIGGGELLPFPGEDELQPLPGEGMGPELSGGGGMDNALTDLTSNLPCKEGAGGSIDCSGLKASTQYMTPKPDPFVKYVSPSAGITLMRWDCEGNLQLGDATTSVQMKAKAEMTHNLMGALVESMTDVMGCRDGVGSSVSETVAKYFAPWGLRSWATAFFGMDASFMGGATIMHKLLEMLSLQGQSIELKNFPDSCNMNTLLAGKCDMSVDLTELTKNFVAPWGGTTGVRMQMDTCPAKAGFAMQGMISCTGSMCEVAKKTIAGGTCSNEKPCPTGYSCLDLSMSVAGIEKEPEGDYYMGETHATNTFLSNMMKRLAGVGTSLSDGSMCLVNPVPKEGTNDAMEKFLQEGIATITSSEDGKVNTVTLGKADGTGSIFSKPANAGAPLPTSTDEKATGPSTGLGDMDVGEGDASAAAGSSAASALALGLLSAAAYLMA